MRHHLDGVAKGSAIILMARIFLEGDESICTQLPSLRSGVTSNQEALINKQSL